MSGMVRPTVTAAGRVTYTWRRPGAMAVAAGTTANDPAVDAGVESHGPPGMNAWTSSGALPCVAPSRSNGADAQGLVEPATPGFVSQLNWVVEPGKWTGYFESWSAAVLPHGKVVKPVHVAAQSVVPPNVKPSAV